MNELQFLDYLNEEYGEAIRKYRKDKGSIRVHFSADGTVTIEYYADSILPPDFGRVQNANKVKHDLLFGAETIRLAPTVSFEELMQ